MVFHLPALRFLGLLPFSAVFHRIIFGLPPILTVPLVVHFGLVLVPSKAAASLDGRCRILLVRKLVLLFFRIVRPFLHRNTRILLVTFRLLLLFVALLPRRVLGVLFLFGAPLTALFAGVSKERFVRQRGEARYDSRNEVRSHRDIEVLTVFSDGATAGAPPPTSSRSPAHGVVRQEKERQCLQNGRTGEMHIHAAFFQSTAALIATHTARKDKLRQDRDGRDGAEYESERGGPNGDMELCISIEIVRVLLAR
mmetsp:Transcript_7306/g.21584  ORF Transcript_7306/g.21584 Transcript_7306/m.21584 type:complete len:253 (+) Transcript_7306:326-1084(+)